MEKGFPVSPRYFLARYLIGVNRRGYIIIIVLSKQRVQVHSLLLVSLPTNQQQPLTQPQSKLGMAKNNSQYFSVCFSLLFEKYLFIFKSMTPHSKDIIFLCSLQPLTCLGIDQWIAFCQAEGTLDLPSTLLCRWHPELTSNNDTRRVFLSSVQGQGQL